MQSRDLFSGEIHVKQPNYLYFQDSWGEEFIKAEYWKGVNGAANDYIEHTVCKKQNRGRIDLKVNLSPSTCFSFGKRISKMVFENKYKEVTETILNFKPVKGDRYLILVERYGRSYFSMVNDKVIQQFTIYQDHVEINDPYSIRDEAVPINFATYKRAISEMIEMTKLIQIKSDFELIRRKYFKVYIKESLNIDQYFLRKFICRDDATSWKYHRPGMLINYGFCGKDGFRMFQFDVKYQEQILERLSKTIYKCRDRTAFLLKENIHYSIDLTPED